MPAPRVLSGVGLVTVMIAAGAGMIAAVAGLVFFIHTRSEVSRNDQHVETTERETAKEDQRTSQEKQETMSLPASERQRFRY